MHSQPNQIDMLPVSPAQRQVWFHKQLARDSVPLIRVAVIRMNGSLRMDILSRSAEVLALRHSSLRTTFATRKDTLMQVVHPSLPVDIGIREIDVDQLPAAIRNELNREIDITQGPLWRISVFRLADDDHVIVHILDQMIVDRYAVNHFVSELYDTYGSLLRGNADCTRAVPDNCVSDRADNESDHVTFWKDYLDTAPPLSGFPLDFQRSNKRSLKGKTVFLDFDAALTRELSARDGALSDTLFAAFIALVARYTQEQDFVIGIEMPLRQTPYIGHGSNVVPLRFHVGDGISFRDLLFHVNDVRQHAAEHAHLPFDQIVSAVNPGHDASYPPLFQILYGLQDEISDRPESLEPAITLMDIGGYSSTYDLTFSIQRVHGRLFAAIEYDSQLITEATVHRFKGHYLELLNSAISNPEHSIYELKLLTDAEREKILNDWVTTKGDYLDKETIHGMFEAQVARSPGATAVVIEDRAVEFSTLNQYVNQLARYLKERGVRSGDVVGVCVERSFDVIVSNLAVLKAGGTYVPLDPAYPAERLLAMIEDTGITTIISRPQYAQQFAELRKTIVPAERNWEDNLYSGYDAGNPPLDTSNKIACILFTSGSTGKPKGVKCGHTSIVNRLYWWTKTYPPEAGEVWCAKSVLNVVDSVWEIFGALLFGVRLVVIPENVLQNIHLFIETLATHGITRIVMIPSLLRAVLEEENLARRLPRLGIWISTGELLPANLLERFRSVLPTVTILNFYGCSENPTITWSNLTQPHIMAPVHIGRPRSNIYVYLLDKHKQLVPVGVHGEIYVGGTGLSDGYVKQADLMSQAFVRNPFDENSVLYRTGDIGHYLPDGNIRLIGRADYQVKIRGFRIELGEIENRLRQNPNIRNALVVDRERQAGSKYLVAYYVVHQGRNIRTSELREYLSQSLPRHMIPEAFMELDAFPLMKNGKIDRKALPEPVTVRADNQEYMAPRNVLEKRIAELWEKILDAGDIGVRDDFFDIGGHSLAAASLLAAIETSLGKRLSMATLFRGPTIEQLALAVAETNEREAANESIRSLIAVQPGDDGKKPFFWLHSSDFTYLKPYFDPTQPFYCIMPSGMNEGEEILESEDDIAEHHVRVIQAKQPVGPYLLGGYCNGGKNALAVAQRLIDRGHEVRLLALVDVPVPDMTRQVYLKRTLYKRLITLIKERRLHRIVLERIRLRFGVHFTPKVLSPVEQRLKDIVAAHDRVFGPYIMKRAYAGEVTLFTCEEVYNRNKEETVRRWNELTTNTVREYIIPGDHRTMIRQPNVRKLGIQLMSVIDEVQRS